VKIPADRAGDDIVHLPDTPTGGRFGGGVNEAADVDDQMERGPVPEDIDPVLLQDFPPGQAVFETDFFLDLGRAEIVLALVGDNGLDDPREREDSSQMTRQLCRCSQGKLRQSKTDRQQLASIRCISSSTWRQPTCRPRLRP
jgi:hypothetical protein